ncbi:MAG: Mut7-C RNAse domain-containing protein [Elusimicrobiota bacterium]|nr:Mut7-C RNAse domain-containing protein [Endomicrobiia bacterium]MDW8165203.1 Mut7-C RNAse domain-containing protein [Elusimicrobiota bacterium]
MTEKPKFIVDFMCGRLARWLRILGYDAEFFNETSRSKILMESLKTQRIILTRDTQLSKKKAYKIILITSDKIRQQVKQVIKDLNLKLNPKEFFSICSICNKKVNKVIDKSEIKDLVPIYIYENINEFYRCPGCNRIYWQGSHYDFFLKEIEKIFSK